MELTAAQRRIIFALVVLVLVALGVYLFTDRSRDSRQRGGSRRRGGPGRGGRGRSAGQHAARYQHAGDESAAPARP